MEVVALSEEKNAQQVKIDYYTKTNTNLMTDVNVYQTKNKDAMS